MFFCIVLIEKLVILTCEWAIGPGPEVWGKVGQGFSFLGDLGTVLWSGIYTPRGPEASADIRRGPWASRRVDVRPQHISHVPKETQPLTYLPPNIGSGTYGPLARQNSKLFY